MATSSSRRHAVHLSASAHRHEEARSHGTLRRIPVIPDFRFERSYMKSIAPYIRTRYTSQDDEEMLDLDSVEWKAVLWITARDQIIGPFFQGAIWGIASMLVRPFFANMAPFLGFRQRKNVHVQRIPRGLANKDSEVVRRLREWSKTLAV